MALNINGTTGISGVDGSVSAPAVTGTDSNTGITFPAADTIKFSTGGVERMSITNSGVTGAGGGKVLQCKVNYDASTVVVTNTGTIGDTYGLTGNRVYGDLNQISITPTSATSTMVIQAVSGVTDSGNGGQNSTGAFGIVAILNNASTGAIDNTDYQLYPETGTLGSGWYGPNVVCQGHYASGNTTAQTWRLKGYSYRESGTNISKFIKHHLIIWEVEI